MKNNSILIVGAVIGVVFLFFVFSSNKAPTGPGELDSFAECITDSGAIFYGAFWCPHCQNQKKLFGNSISKINYVECSTPDGKGQVPVCEQAGVTLYPTWLFGDGSTTTGEVSLEDLAKRTNCQLSTTTPAI